MITVTMTKEQWAATIRLMNAGSQEGTYYVGKDEEEELLMDAICSQTGVSRMEADEMEPKRDFYVPR